MSLHLTEEGLAKLIQLIKSDIALSNHSHKLEALTDVDIYDIKDGEALVWDGNYNKWLNKKLSDIAGIGEITGDVKVKLDELEEQLRLTGEELAFKVNNTTYKADKDRINNKLNEVEQTLNSKASLEDLENAINNIIIDESEVIRIIEENIISAQDVLEIRNDIEANANNIQINANNIIANTIKMESLATRSELEEAIGNSVSGNLLNDSGFELGSDSWVISNARYDNTISYAGNVSMKLEGILKEEVHAGQTLDIIPDKSYTISGMYKKDNIEFGTNNPLLQIRIRCYFGTEILKEVTIDFGEGTCDWTFFSNTFYVPQETTKVILHILGIDYTGVLHVDSMKLERGIYATEWTPSLDDNSYLLNQLMARLHDAEQTIIDAKTEISLKVDQESYDTTIGGITDRVESTESNISTLSVDMSKRVLQSEYNDKVGRLETTLADVRSDLDITAGELSSKVSQTVYDSDMGVINGVLSETQSSITQQAGLIESKVNKVDYDADKNDLEERVTATESRITQQDNEIALMVKQTDYIDGVNSLNEKIIENTSLINQTADEVVTKVSQSEYVADKQEIVERVSNTESQITVQAGEIAQKVSKETYSTDKDTMEKRMEESESLIEQHEDQILLRVTQNDMSEYVSSRDENLVTNGSGSHGDNLNFTLWTFDGSNKCNSNPSFFTDSQNSFMRTDELIPIDATKTYRFQFYAKSSNATGLNYGGFATYDVDKKEMEMRFHYYNQNSTTTLAQDLNDGDTVVYLTSVAGFNKTTTATHQKGLIFWNYVDSQGFAYPIGTYSRNSFLDIWADSSSIDSTNNTITLKSAWTGGTFTAGTSVSQTDSGGYKYCFSDLGNKTIPTNWTKYSTKIYPSNEGSVGVNYKLPYYCKYIRPIWLANRTNEGDSIWVSGVEIYNIENEKYTDKEISNAKAEIKVTTDSIQSSVSKNTTSISGLDTKISNVDSKVTQTASEIRSEVTNKVNQINTEISGLGDDISSINTTLSSQQSQITQNANNINLRVTESQAQSIANTSATNAVNNIKNGGRNLLKKSNVRASNTGYPTGTYYLVDTTLTEGEQVTVSMKATLGTNKTHFSIYNSGGNVSMVNLTNSDKDSSGIFRKTFNWKITSGSYTASNTFINVYPMPSSVTGVTSTIEWIMLERGNKPSTSWLPAIEDTEAKLQGNIDTLSTKVTTNTTNIGLNSEAINLRATKTEAQTYATNAVNNLQIGGENLLVNSKFDKNGDKWSNGKTYLTFVTEDGFKCAKIVGTTGVAKIVQQNIYEKIKMDNRASQEYTFSAWIKVVDLVYGSTNPHVMFYGEYATDTSDYASFQSISGERTFKAYNNQGWKKVVWRFKLPMAFKAGATSANFQIYCRDFTGTIFFRELKIEKGNKCTDWSQSSDDMYGQLVDVSTRLSNAELKIEPNAIISTVSESEALQTMLEGKANVSDIANMATQDYVNGAISNVDFEGIVDTKVNTYVNTHDSILNQTYATTSALEQRSNEITAKFSQAGGLNLIHNSLGYNGVNDGYWISTNNANIICGYDPDTSVLGVQSSIHIKNNTTNVNYLLKQTFPTISGEKYTISYYYKKVNSSSSNGVYSYAKDEVNNADISGTGHRILAVSNGYQYYSYTFTAVSSKTSACFTIYSNENNEVYLTKIMAHVGDTPLSWSLAPDELYNTNVSMSIDGLKVSQKDSNGNTIGYTIVSPDEFAGYYDIDANGSYERIFYLNEDATVSKRLAVTDAIIMGGLKAVNIKSNSDNIDGWAFIPTTLSDVRLTEK